jgi:dipeptidyl aminopeptidase/acylaminoacyl peptidase
MNRVTTVLAATLAIVFLSVSATQTFAQSHPPIEAFGNLPAVADARLSPDGKYMADIQTMDGKPVAAIYQVNAPAGAKPAFVASPDGIIVAVRWAKNDRLVIIEKANLRKFLDRLRTWWRAVSVDPQGHNAVALFNGDAALSFNVATAAVADVDLDDPDHIFMPLYRRGRDQGEYVMDMDRVNVRDGTAETFISGVLSSAGWIMDGHGHAVAAYSEYPHERAVHLKIRDGENWREVNSFPTGTDYSGTTEGLTDDASSLVMGLLSQQRRMGLYAFELAKATVTPLFEDPSYDYAHAIRDEWMGAVIGGTYVDDKSESVYFDPKREHLQKTMEAAFPGRTVRLASYDVAKKAYIFNTDGPQEPDTYYYLDTATMHAFVVGTAYPQLPADALGVMRPYSYSARDGVSIHAYLTLPPTGKTSNLPIVVMPHGGPLDRDEIHFDWWAQFLANRGYAVFQPNFRGSSGYGQSFADAGKNEWGLKMQDDITDGVEKLIADGTADAKRICIVGASYGGYAALAGAAFTPDLYRCAVSFAGVFDLDRMLSTEIKDYGEGSDAVAIWESRIGDPDKDAERIAATSPAKHADRIKIPILLLHASADTTVPVEQSQIMNDALQKAGKSVRFITIDGDDHYLDLASTRVRVLDETEKFLAANIGVEATSTPQH